MNKAMTPTRVEPKSPLVDVQDVKGWCEYEPSYDGVVTHINTAGARLFGFNSPDDVIGKKINELYAHPFDHEKTLAMLFRDGYVHGFYTLMKSRKGNLFFIKQTSSLVTEGIDITPLKVKNEFEPVFQPFDV
ncbi:MAG: PAS domain-containing protein [Planctomycetes bacterium]|nr:PAS domain-containing protein [Planctomycetota bacterium]